ncbi:MAG: hypothetical protein KAI43_01195 [Candidatus Aureabacteria bacterium]|nr:hypothetical protein [Candidatus Auribacterota bacterium]
MKIFKIISLIAAVILPLWNIPLILRIIKRKSSKDLSLYWVFGVWTCLLLMFPAAVVSTDIVWKVFNIVNIVMFSLVVVVAVLYHKSDK